MKARHSITTILLLACSLTQAQAQQEFPYPTMPDTLRSVEQRAAYLSEHYWDNFNFADTLLLQNKEVTELGFVNFTDMLERFSPSITTLGINRFIDKAFATPRSKEVFYDLTEHYFESSLSPVHNDRLYLMFLNGMMSSRHFDETEKEKISYKIKVTNKNLPGDIALNFSFTDKKGKKRQLSEWSNQKVILYFYDPECETCHQTTSWLKKQNIPTEIAFIPIIANMEISNLYNLRTMPTLYLLDKGNKVLLKECTAQQLIESISAHQPQ